MAASVKKQMYLYATADGVAPEVRANQKISASEGILIPGAPLFLSTSGTWDLAITSAGSSNDAWHGFLVGLQDPTATWPMTAAQAVNTEIRVLIIDPDDTYAVRVNASGTDSAATQAIIGNNYGLTVSATSGQVGYTSLDTDNSNATVKVTQVMGNVEPSKYDLTSTPGVALVKFLAAVVTDTQATS